jgi:hypothetical protein
MHARNMLALHPSFPLADYQPQISYLQRVTELLISG